MLAEEGSIPAGIVLGRAVQLSAYDFYRRIKGRLSGNEDYLPLVDDERELEILVFDFFESGLLAPVYNFVQAAVEENVPFFKFHPFNIYREVV